MIPSKVLENLEIKNLNHLGIIAGIIDEIGIVEIINKELGEERSEIVSSGVIIKAIIINGLGFLSKPLYLFPQFFEDKATAHLLGKGISAENLNDDKIGRVMDKCYHYGISELFLLLSLAAVKKYQINLGYSHLDSTSFSVHGEYKKLLPGLRDYCEEVTEKANVFKEIPIKITHGYSRDHRPDLKQFMLNMIVAGDGDVPIFIETGSGNQSDKKTFGVLAKKYKKQLCFETTIVADSALYSQSNLNLMKEISWVTRVPLSIKEAKEIVTQLGQEEFTKSEIPGYLYREVENKYGGIKQRWLVVESESRKKSDIKKLEEKIDKESKLLAQKLASLSKKEFETEIEANLQLRQIESKLKYHLISQSLVTEKLVKKSKKRYQITAIFQSNDSKIISLKSASGRFIIATNKLDKSSFTSNDILKKYKEQQAPERGFAFLKDPLFFADSVFLKNPQRVETMAMLMGLCLMVYSLGQRQIRASLQAAKTGIKNQLGKLTERPTLRWIFQCFQGIHLVVYQENQHIANLTSERHLTLRFFPKSIQKYYILSG
jgi:transposase